MFIELCILVLLILAFVYYKFNENFNYWNRLGVPCLSVKEQKANAWDFVMQKRAGHDIKKREYRKFDGERFYGIFDGVKQILVIRDDFELIRSILVKDFDYFGKSMAAAFGTLEPSNRTEQIQMKGITIIHGDEWKAVRYKIHTHQCIYVSHTHITTLDTDNIIKFKQIGNYQ